MALNMLKDVPDKLRELKEKQFIEEKRRQRLRENCQELRELERNLKTAYFVKELKEQQLQLETQKKQQRENKTQEGIQIEVERQKNEEILRQQAKAELERKENLRKTLDQQMTESLQRRKNGIEELAQDRYQAERLLQRLKIEQEQANRFVHERQQKLRTELDEFRRQQEEYRNKQKAIDEEERLKAEAIQRLRDKELQKLTAAKQAERKQQAMVSEQLGLQLKKQEIEKQRREAIMLELLEEERKSKEDHRFRQNLERQVRAREFARLELEQFIEQRKLQKEQERRHKLETERAEISALIAANEKAAKLEMQRLREKEAAFNAAIQQMIQERQKERATKFTTHLKDFELLREEERKIQQEIEEERRRLLSQQPTEIFKYLPAGVLRDADREFLALPPEKK